MMKNKEKMPARYRKDGNSTSSKTPDLRQSITKRTAAAMTTTVPGRAAHSPLPHIPLRSRVQLLAFVNYGSQAVTPKMEEASDVDNAGKKFTMTTTANNICCCCCFACIIVGAIKIFQYIYIYMIRRKLTHIFARIKK